MLALHRALSGDVYTLYSFGAAPTAGQVSLNLIIS